jgi:hypothetical protein
MTLTPMQDALYHIEHDVQAVRAELTKRVYDEGALADLDAALINIAEALGEALDAYTRLSRKRR